LKRTVSILLLSVFLFNVGGYYIVFWGLRQHADQALAKKLDAGLYVDEETIELKIPVTLPYPLQQRGYERVEGRFEHKGEFYKLVKQKHAHDTLYVICIRDSQEKKLVKTMQDYAKMTNDLPSSSKKALHFLGKFLKDFETAPTGALLHHQGWSKDLSFTVRSFSTLDQTIVIPSPPPEV
jgi:hypothetical protein